MSKPVADRSSPRVRLEIKGLAELSPDALLATNGGRGRSAAPSRPLSPVAPERPAGFFEALLRPFR